jgi:hypothetical protein
MSSRLVQVIEPNLKDVVPGLLKSQEPGAGQWEAGLFGWGAFIPFSIFHWDNDYLFVTPYISTNL